MSRLRFGLAMGKYNVHSPSFEPPSKRGGSGTNALTNTLDASLVSIYLSVLFCFNSNIRGSTSIVPDSSSRVQIRERCPQDRWLRRRCEHTFSFAHFTRRLYDTGFIGLIVGLGVLILICCCAVFYLLRTRPHGGRSGNRNHQPSNSSSLPTGIFASARSKRNAGWVRQTDEFNYDSGEDEDISARSGAVRYGDGGSGYTGQPMRDARLKTLASPGINSDAYSDPFDPARLPDSVRRQQAPLPAASREFKGVPHEAVEHSPTGSFTASFEGGTKFKEQF